MFDQGFEVLSDIKAFSAKRLSQFQDTQFLARYLIFGLHCFSSGSFYLRYE